MSAIDEIGNQYGKLTVVGRSGTNAQGLATWHCTCDCGGCKIVSGVDLRQGRVKSCGCLSALIDETGNRYGLLTVRKRVNTKHGRAWLCSCECGGKTTVSGGNLRNGRRISCGCKAVNKPLPSGESMARTLFQRYRYNATRRGLSWELTEVQFRDLVAQTCHYCGAGPSQKCEHPRGNGAYIYTGIDRIDNDLGYTKVNCVTCCRTCNLAKRAMSRDEFKEWVQRAYHHFARDP